ncbi:hypothetical protein HH310_36025 [Actinoplanes sp. TBRC 11911]|uniref:hypothetical protein n=1 Tax=Actinoplanes sp. TBRC 11911 TaxID=2729386 RepID=UPI00145CF6B5|nr:hypothetical protein [Actinoplanes sp. TBRC 11911]NMO56570.1 hypothetical protein [Actinoplanes sp. TBRC 11911]
MTVGKQPYQGWDMVRHADAYPQVLRAARLYLGGFAWLAVSGLTVAYADLSSWFLLATALAVPLVVAGALTARDAFARLEQELVPDLPITEIRSAATIVGFRDLFRRRPRISEWLTRSSRRSGARRVIRIRR